MTAPPTAPGRPSRGLLYAAIFASGMAGLMHEIVWSKVLVSLIGSTAHAQVAVLAVFMVGLALGSFLFGRNSDRRERPLLLYARLELLIAAYGLLLPLVLRLAGAGYEALARASSSRAPGSSPCASRSRSCASSCRRSGWGARSDRRALPGRPGRVDARRGRAPVRAEQPRGRPRVGPVRLLDAVGLRDPAVAGRGGGRERAGGLPRVAGPGPRERAAEASRPVQVRPEPEAAPGPLYTRAQYTATLVALFASGFAAMGYEVLFTRVIALSFGSSTYSFTVMLMSFITGIGIGSAIVARLRVERPLWLFGASQLAAASRSWR
jgi:spermidine synthase